MGNLGESYLSNLHNILDNGYSSKPRGMDIKELLGSTICGKADEAQILSYPGIRDVANPETPEGKYLMSELLWYMSGSRMHEFIGLHGKIWTKITNIDLSVNSNYGRSVFYEDPKGNSVSPEYSRFDKAFLAMQIDKDTRQSIIHYSSPRVFDHGYDKDFTCTQLQQFFIRDDTLHTIVYIRSSDAVFGLNYDIPFWSLAYQTMLYKYLAANEKVLKTGEMKIFIGSSHIYGQHNELCKNILESTKGTFKRISFKLGALNERPYEGLEEARKKVENFLDRKYNLGSSIKLFPMISISTDPEGAYADREEGVFASAKLLMKLFRTMLFIIKEYDSCGNFTNAGDINKDLKQEILALWNTITKDWFDTYFAIA